MQRGEEFLECIVTLMSVYHNPLPGKVSRHRRVSADATGSGNEGIEPRIPTPHGTHACTGTANGTRRTMTAHLLGPDDAFIHYARSQPG